MLATRHQSIASEYLLLCSCRLLQQLLDVVTAQLPLKRVGPDAGQRRAARQQQQQPAAGRTESEEQRLPAKKWSLAEDLLAQGRI